MENTMTAASAKKRNAFARNFVKNYPLIFFLLPALAVILIFAYGPMYGILMAFQDFIPGDEIISEYTQWVGFDQFTRFFNDFNFSRLMWNTFILCIYGFVVGFPLPIVVALMLNATRSKRASGILQTVFYAPHFISLVVMVGMLYLFFGRYGLFNNMAVALGLDRHSWFLDQGAFRSLYVWSGLWQEFGWSAIIYLAALSSVDPSQHEAAVIDGASRFQRVIHIDLPAIIGTVSIVLILSIGGLMGAGYEKAFLMQTGANLETSEIISTFVYKRGLTGQSDPGYATAVGLFNSVINVILLVIANTTSKVISKNSLW